MTPDFSGILADHGQLLVDLGPILGAAIVFGFILSFINK